MQATEGYKLVVVGGGGVGKSSLTIRYCTDHFIQELYDPTIDTSYRKQVIVDKQSEEVEIIDTSGPDECFGPPSWLREGQGFLLVYSVTASGSLSELNKHVDTLVRVRESPNIPFVVVGNKSDLVDERKVSVTEGQKYAAKNHAAHFEVSAKTNVNVEECFAELLRRTRAACPINKKNQGRCVLC